jgi:hypothetical protein
VYIGSFITSWSSFFKYFSIEVDPQSISPLTDCCFLSNFPWKSMWNIGKRCFGWIVTLPSFANTYYFVCFSFILLRTNLWIAWWKGECSNSESCKKFGSKSVSFTFLILQAYQIKKAPECLRIILLISLQRDVTMVAT